MFQTFGNALHVFTTSCSFFLHDIWASFWHSATLPLSFPLTIHHTQFQKSSVFHCLWQAARQWTSLCRKVFISHGLEQLFHWSTCLLSDLLSDRRFFKLDRLILYVTMWFHYFPPLRLQLWQHLSKSANKLKLVLPKMSQCHFLLWILFMAIDLFVSWEVLFEYFTFFFCFI